MLGVGTGEALNEIAVGRLEWPDFKERFARLRESIELMRQLWTEDRVTFDGEYYQTTDATIYDRPDRPIPVYIAAGGPVVARYAGRVGDGFICTSGKGMELYTDKLLPAVDEGRSKAGDPGADRPDDRDQALLRSRSATALENTRFWAPLALTAEQKHGMTTRSRWSGGGRAAHRADRLALDRRLRPRDAVEAVKPYVDLGFTHLVFHAPGHDQGRFLDQFTRDVAPLIRAAGTLGISAFPPTGSFGDHLRHYPWSDLMTKNHTSDEASEVLIRSRASVRPARRSYAARRASAPPQKRCPVPQPTSSTPPKPAARPLPPADAGHGGQRRQPRSRPPSGWQRPRRRPQSAQSPLARRLASAPRSPRNRPGPRPRRGAARWRRLRPPPPSTPPTRSGSGRPSAARRSGWSACSPSAVRQWRRCVRCGTRSSSCCRSAGRHRRRVGGNLDRGVEHPGTRSCEPGVPMSDKSKGGREVRKPKQPKQPKVVAAVAVPGKAAVKKTK